MQTSALALSLIQKAEGFCPSAYICPAGQVTIGYGNTSWEDGEPVRLGDEIDEAGATQLLWSYMRNEVEPALDRLIKVPLQIHQRDAFASFLFNMGESKARSYTLTRLINEEAPTAEICDWWVKYRMGGGKPLLGLYRRRLAEVMMWNALPIDKAWTATEKTTWRELVGVPEYTPVKAEPEPVLILDKPLPKETKPVARTITLPEEWDKMTAAQQTAWLNTGEFIALGGTPGEPIKPAPLPDAAKPKRSTTAKPPKAIEDISYLPKGVAPKVERIEDSQRGKAVETVAQAKVIGTIGAAGWMSQQLGAIEPIMKATKAYTPQMVTIFFVGVITISVVLFYYGKWLRRKGERDATTLLG
jgi:lysozyme